MTEVKRRVDYFGGPPSSGFVEGVTAVLSCGRCDGSLQLVNVGRIVATQEGSVILKCDKCMYRWHLHVMMTPMPRDDRQRKSTTKHEEYA